MEEGVFTSRPTMSNAFLAVHTLRVVAITPLVEEIFWRGYFQGVLQRLTRGSVALMVQAILFTLVHMRGLAGSITLFLDALLYGVWRWRKGTLVPLIVAHMVLNGLACMGRWMDELELRTVRVSQDYRIALEAMCRPQKAVSNENALHDYTRAMGLLVERPTALNETDVRTWPAGLPPYKATLLKAWINSNERAVREFTAGCEKPYFWHDYSKMPMKCIRYPVLSDLRAMVLVVMARAQLHAIEQDFDQSVADLLSCFRLGQHLRGPTPLVEQLMGIAIQQEATTVAFRVLSHFPDNPHYLRELPSRLGVILDGSASSMSFSGEHLMCRALVEEHFTDDGNGGGHIPRASIRRMVFSRTHPRAYGSSPRDYMRRWETLERKETQKRIDELFAYLASVEKSPPFELLNRGVDLQSAMEQVAEHNVFLEELIPAYAKAYFRAYRQRASVDAMVVVAAILRYRQEQGRCLDELNELIQVGYLASLPQDPFTGLPFFYRSVGNGFLLHSAGEDFADDLGTRRVEDTGGFDGVEVFWPRTDD